MLNSPKSQPVFIGQVLHTPKHLCSHTLDLLQLAPISVMVRTPDVNGVLQVGSFEGRVEW